jgi:aspartate racemase
MIGIVGGIGPLAGADMYKQIVANTVANADQDHLPVMLASLPGEIVDRMPFLLHGTGENPAIGIAKVIRMLENAGADLIAIACNTAHSPPIFERLLELLEAQGSRAEIINLINITIQDIITRQGRGNHVGVLSTTGAYKVGLFQNALQAAGLKPLLLPFERHEDLIHKAIFRIKVSGEVVEEQVIEQLNIAIQELELMGAQSILLGCTEIGMIEKSLDFKGMAVFNPNTIMARALISKISPEKLKP